MMRSCRLAEIHVYQLAIVRQASHGWYWLCGTAHHGCIRREFDGLTVHVAKCVTYPALLPCGWLHGADR